MAKYILENENRFIIYGIEEPEIGLHPHAQRQLIYSLKKLRDYSQVIISTHSDRLVDVSEVTDEDSIIRIVREKNKTTHYTIDLEPKDKKILEVHGRNLNEIFFAKRCLIVEGEVEEGFFPEASKKIIEQTERGEENFSFDYNSVSVINGGGDKIWFFVKILKKLAISFVLLIDEDKIENRENFLKKLIETGIIAEQEKENFKVNDNLFDSLKKKNIFVLPPFEKIISENCPREKVNKAINFVRENWGIDEPGSDLTKNNQLSKDKIFNLLKKNKRWRIGKAIAQELEKGEIPRLYVEIIKKVSKL